TLGTGTAPFGIKDILPYFLVKDLWFEGFGDHIVTAGGIKALQAIVQRDRRKGNNRYQPIKFSYFYSGLFPADSGHVYIHKDTIVIPFSNHGHGFQAVD